jgi:hypothetical protein
MNWVNRGRGLRHLDVLARAKFASLLPIALCMLAISAPAFATSDLQGRVLDPQGLSIAYASVSLAPVNQGSAAAATTDQYGYYEFHDVIPGSYHLTAQSPDFAAVSIDVTVIAGGASHADLKFVQLAAKQQQVVVASQPTALTPDPSQRIIVRDEVLDANPGRPGAPLSIPGLPVETASGGIKAPQYFAPGVAGDHGEPIAQYFQVGDFLFPNNLPANAHGNGYSDPNSLIAPGIGAVQIDGGAFNVREGNHAVNLAAAYAPRDRVEPLLELTGDNHDADVIVGWAPSNPATRAWVALETGFGNGYLNRPEHRKQFKLNGYRAYTLGRHELRLLGIGYYGFSNIPGLIPRDVPVPGDTIDPRQRDRTHTSIVVVSDTWNVTGKQQLDISGFFRTYSLQLRSNFGDGLIQQSEFRTVAGGNTTYVYKFRKDMSLVAGFDLRRDAPRGLDLKRDDANGVFQPVTSNDLTLGIASPYAALDGSLTKYLHYDAGIRQEEVFFNNVDKITAANSFSTQAGLTLPKATFTLSPPGEKFLPIVSFSIAEGFHTNDPRIGPQGSALGTVLVPAHASQLVIQKTILKTELRATLARITNAEELAKIDPDTGLQQDLGPSIIKSVTVSARRYFHIGYLQGSFARADARDRVFSQQTPGQPVPEAPRLIWDAVGGINHLPFGLQAHGEFEYVGRKFLGNDDAGNALTATPVREIRGALLRSFAAGRLDAGLNFLLASGFTGQTVESLQVQGDPAPIPRVVGVPLKSYASVSLVYHFGHPREPRP